MINQNLHRQPAALDSAIHRQLKLKVPITDWSLANQLNALFLAAAEFGDACKEFPIVFVKAGKEADGSDSIAPIAVLGMVANDNLFLQDGKWRAQYMPAILRMYPFCIGRLDEERFAICLDMAFAGVNQTEGAAGFHAGRSAGRVADHHAKATGGTGIRDPAHAPGLQAHHGTGPARRHAF